MSINVVPQFSKREPIIDVEKFKKMYLFATDLRDINGNILPDETIQMFLDIGIDYVEMELNAPVTKQNYTYFEDYMIANYKQYCYIQLPIYPIIDITQVTLTYGFDETSGTPEGLGIEFPHSWYRIYATSGQLQLLPTVATVNSLILRGTGFTMKALRGDALPQILKVEYAAGWDNNVPPLMNQAIGLSTAVYLLQMIGEVSPTGTIGVSGASVGLDGMSQSISTPISGGSNIYSATIAKYQDMLQNQVLRVLKRKYKRISLAYI